MKERTAIPTAMSKECLNSFFISQYYVFFQAMSHEETDMRFRPLARRFDKTVRPPRVSMRDRKPCLFLRRLLLG